MRFQHLVLEGDKRAEKNMKEEFLPAYTKSAYSRRKLRERRPPLYNRSFYLCRMIEESLKGTELDGSGKIIVCAHHNRLVPGNETYLCDRFSHISIYYLEQEEIEAIDAAGGAAEPVVLWRVLRAALLDIARCGGASEAVRQRIEAAFTEIIARCFVREDPIKRLTKRDKGTGLTAHVTRVLSAETGEGWRIKITDRKGIVLRQEAIEGHIQYVDRLGSRLYAKAEWRGDAFMLLDRFGKKTYRISVPSQII